MSESNGHPGNKIRVCVKRTPRAKNPKQALVHGFRIFRSMILMETDRQGARSKVLPLSGSEAMNMPIDGASGR
jgi:hypothetical protein